MFVSFFVVATVAAFTPGPNNSMLMQSGMYFGIKKTIPHMLGVIFGFNPLFLGVNMGLGALLLRYPTITIFLKILGSAYFLYLAYRMVLLKPPALSPTSNLDINTHTNSTPEKNHMEKIGITYDNSKKKQEIHTRDTLQQTTSKPLSFFMAMLFQLVNVKAWFFAISAVAVLPDPKTMEVIVGAQVIVLFVTACSASTWTLGGYALAKLFKHTLYFRITGVLLALSLVYAIILQWT